MAYINSYKLLTPFDKKKFFVMVFNICNYIYRTSCYSVYIRKYTGSINIFSNYGSAFSYFCAVGGSYGETKVKLYDENGNLIGVVEKEDIDKNFKNGGIV